MLASSLEENANLLKKYTCGVSAHAVVGAGGAAVGDGAGAYGCALVWLAGTRQPWPNKARAGKRRRNVLDILIAVYRTFALALPLGRT